MALSDQPSSRTAARMRWQNAYTKICTSSTKIAAGECNDEITQFLASMKPDAIFNTDNPFRKRETLEKSCKNLEFRLT